jgi:hypothetical protein
MNPFKETVFILGAGASVPYGYPAGRDFKDDICLNFRSDMDSLFKTAGDSRTAFDLSDLMDKAEDFISSFQASRIVSIDRWLSHNYSRYGNIGKLAIVNSIVKHENPERLLFEGYKKDKSLDWFTVLFNQMISDFSRPEHFMYLQPTFPSIMTGFWNISFMTASRTLSQRLRLTR